MYSVVYNSRKLLVIRWVAQVLAIRIPEGVNCMLQVKLFN